MKCEECRETDADDVAIIELCAECERWLCEHCFGDDGTGVCRVCRRREAQEAADLAAAEATP